MCRSTVLEEYFSAVPRPTVPPKQRPHQPSLTIVMDAQLPSKEGSGSLKNYYDMWLIALLVGAALENFEINKFY